MQLNWIGTFYYTVLLYYQISLYEIFIQLNEMETLIQEIYIIKCDSNLYKDFMQFKINYLHTHILVGLYEIIFCYNTVKLWFSNRVQKRKKVFGRDVRITGIVHCKYLILGNCIQISPAETHQLYSKIVLQRRLKPTMEIYTGIYDLLFLDLILLTVLQGTSIYILYIQ